MAARMKSPNYPSMPLGQAVDLVGKMYASERTNSVDRKVAAQALGYAGITGRSAKVLSDLSQYGLLLRTGKNEVRVSARAVDVLHPDTPAAQAEALRAAATEPELFQRIEERFSAGRPSDAALRSFLLREGFTDAAIPSAKRAYLETVEFVQEMIGSESNMRAPDWDRDSGPDQQLEADADMKAPPRREFPSGPERQRIPAKHEGRRGKPEFRWVDNELWLDGGVIATQEDADDAVAFINAVRPMLKAQRKAAPRDDEKDSESVALLEGPATLAEE